MILNLCRAKRADNGEWIEGFYANDQKRHYIITEIVDKDHALYGQRSENVKLFVVVPETVSQFVGKIDINGVKIRENHIISFERFNDKYIGKVVFNTTTCGFEIWYKSVVGGGGETALHKINFANAEKTEVLGNVFDNLELIKELAGEL